VSELEETHKKEALSFLPPPYLRGPFLVDMYNEAAQERKEGKRGTEEDTQTDLEGRGGRRRQREERKGMRMVMKERAE